MPILDFHTHAFPDSLAERAMQALAEDVEDGVVETDGTLGGLIALMDRHGVDMAVLANIATKPAQCQKIIQWSLQVKSDRIIPFGSIHPDSEDIAGDMQAIVDAGLKGVKLHPLYQQFEVDDRHVFPLYEAVEQSGLPLLCHAGYDIGFGDVDIASSDRFTTVLDNFPKLRIVMAHFGGWIDYDRFLEHVCGRDVWIDTSFAAGYCTDAQRDAILNKHDRQRIVFASDSPWGGIQLQLDYVRKMPLSDAEKEAIFYTNGARLLGLE
ncbi:MAG: amidohydrolase family protein [Candidatus Sumerlaeia bacterium]